MDREIFYTFGEAKILLERWRQKYNTFTPHSALSYRPTGTRDRGMATDYRASVRERGRSNVGRGLNRGAGQDSGASLGQIRKASR